TGGHRGCVQAGRHFSGPVNQTLGSQACPPQPEEAEAESSIETALKEKFSQKKALNIYYS
ncbi:Hypothetical protein FKW44_009541, partial [Caligus rogercresseyi]